MWIRERRVFTYGGKSRVRDDSRLEIVALLQVKFGSRKKTLAHVENKLVLFLTQKGNVFRPLTRL